MALKEALVFRVRIQMRKWLIAKRALSVNPFTEVEGVGRRKKGKSQLTIDEARKFTKMCFAEESCAATAALCCVLPAMRSGEVVGLTPRSIDDDGRLLRVFEAKTDAGCGSSKFPRCCESGYRHCRGHNHAALRQAGQGHGG